MATYSFRDLIWREWQKKESKKVVRSVVVLKHYFISRHLIQWLSNWGILVFSKRHICLAGSWEVGLT